MDDLYVNDGQLVAPVGQGKYLNMPMGKNKLMRPLAVVIVLLGVNEIVTATVFAKLRSALVMLIEN